MAVTSRLVTGSGALVVPPGYVGASAPDAAPTLLPVLKHIAFHHCLYPAIAREADGGIYQHVGPEIGVASTKAFTSQVIALAMFTLKLARLRSLSVVQGRNIVQAMQSLPQQIQQILDGAPCIELIAEARSLAAISEALLRLCPSAGSPILASELRFRVRRQHGLGKADVVVEGNRLRESVAHHLVIHGAGTLACAVPGLDLRWTRGCPTQLPA
mgnify:CR=1 FL=1